MKKNENTQGWCGSGEVGISLIDSTRDTALLKGNSAHTESSLLAVIPPPGITELTGQVPRTDKYAAVLSVTELGG